MENSYNWKDNEPMLTIEDDSRNVGQYLRDVKEVYQKEKTELANALHRYIKYHLNRGLFKVTDNITDAKRLILEEKYL